MRRIGYEDERITRSSRIWREGRRGGSEGAKPGPCDRFWKLSAGNVDALIEARISESIDIYLSTHATYVSSEPRVFPS